MAQLGFPWNYLRHAIVSMLSAIFILTTTDTVFAQNNCTDALIQDVLELDVRTAEGLAISQLRYIESGRDQNWAASFRGRIVGGASFAESERRRQFDENNLNWSRERIISLATQTLSRNALEAYNLCLNAGQNSGIQIFVHNSTPSSITASIRWVAPLGFDSTTDDVDVTVTSGSISTTPFPTRWRSQQVHTVSIARDAGSDVTIIANIAGQSNTAFVSKIEVLAPPPTTRYELRVASSIGRGGAEGVRFWGPEGEVCHGLPNAPWGHYDAQPRAVSQLGRCVGHGGMAGSVLWGPVGEPCGGMRNNAWGVYENPINITESGIAYCNVNHHHFWGPFEEPCNGRPGIGLFSRGRIVYNSVAEGN